MRPSTRDMKQRDKRTKYDANMIPYQEVHSLKGRGKLVHVRQRDAKATWLFLGGKDLIRLVDFVFFALHRDAYEITLIFVFVLFLSFPGDFLHQIPNVS